MAVLVNNIIGGRATAKMTPGMVFASINMSLALLTPSIFKRFSIRTGSVRKLSVYFYVSTATTVIIVIGLTCRAKRSATRFIMYAAFCVRIAV